jgi:hypothetical protein
MELGLKTLEERGGGGNSTRYGTDNKFLTEKSKTELNLEYSWFSSKYCPKQALGI